MRASRRPTVRYHSDCDYFAGCENMLANFFSDGRLRGGYSLSFSYRSSPDYERGLRERVHDLPRLLPPSVLDFHQVSRIANAWPAPLRILYKALLRLLLVKHWLFLWDVLALYRSFREERIDVLQINNGGFPGALSCLAAGPAARLCGVRKVVHVVNNTPVPYNTPDRWLDRPLDLLAARSADFFIAGSDPTRRGIIELLGLPAERVLAMPNGIASRPIVEQAPALRTRLRVPTERPLVAVVAVLEQRKGHRVLLEALAQLKREGLTPFPVTAFGGDGPLRAELERSAHELGLSEDILFLGWLDRHFDLFNAAEIVALPSSGFEDFPNVILEAMSLGKAVVATRVGGVEEQFMDGESGLLARPGDAADLARVLGLLCRDRILRERLGRAARERFQAVFTAEASVQRYLSLYERLLDKRTFDAPTTK